MDLRETVLQRLRRRGRTNEWLAVRLELRGVCSATAVHRWLSGRGDTKARIAGEALDELGIGLEGEPASWGTVRIGATVVVCRVGDANWARGGWREAAGSHADAVKARERRLQGLARFRR